MCAEILLKSTFQGADKVRPEFCFLCERNVLGVEVEGGHSEEIIVDLTPKVLFVFYLAGAEGQLSGLCEVSCEGPNSLMSSPTGSQSLFVLGESGFWQKFKLIFTPQSHPRSPHGSHSHRQSGSREINN